MIEKGATRTKLFEKTFSRSIPKEEIKTKKEILGYD